MQFTRFGTVVLAFTALVVQLLVSSGGAALAQDSSLDQSLRSVPATRQQDNSVIMIPEDMPPPAAAESQDIDATQALRTLQLPREPSPFLIRIARKGVLVDITRQFLRQRTTIDRSVQVNDILDDSIVLLELPGSLTARNPDLVGLSVVVGKDAIALVDVRTRSVVIVIDKTTYVAATTDPEYNIYIDMTGGNVFLSSLSARLSKEVFFDFNKAELNALAREQLSDWGVYLRQPELRDAQFLIVGHTDHVGSDRYNLALSFKRAKSVIRHLRSVAGSRVRFSARGAGWHELKFPDAPEDSGNRRVEIIRVFSN